MKSSSLWDGFTGLRFNHSEIPVCVGARFSVRTVSLYPTTREQNVCSVTYIANRILQGFESRHETHPELLKRRSIESYTITSKPAVDIVYFIIVLKKSTWVYTLDYTGRRNLFLIKSEIGN